LGAKFENIRTKISNSFSSFKDKLVNLLIFQNDIIDEILKDEDSFCPGESLNISEIF
jgi:hypothetical protein